MSKVKSFLPLIFVFILCVGFLIYVSNVFDISDYKSKISELNTQMKSIQSDISTYEVGMEQDFDKEIDYINEDGNMISDLQSEIALAYSDYFKKYPDATDMPEYKSDAQKKISKYVDEESEDFGKMISCWSDGQEVSNIVFSYLFDTMNSQSLDVAWYIYDKENKLIKVCTAKYNRHDRLYSDLNFEYVME